MKDGLEYPGLKDGFKYSPGIKDGFENLGLKDGLEYLGLKARLEYRIEGWVGISRIEE